MTTKTPLGLKEVRALGAMSLSESYTESFSLLLIIKIWLASDLGSPKSSSLKLSPTGDY